LKKEEPKCYTLILVSLYLDFKLKSNWVCLKIKMHPGPRKKSLGQNPDPRKKSADPGPGLNMPAAP
jgi:hypothetical protein